MNLGQTALQVLKTVAPTLALAVGGPFGPIAAAAIHAGLGTADEKGADATLVSATPEQLLALKKAESDFQTQMKALDISEAKLSFDDTANARAREIAVKDSTPRILAYIIVMLVIGLEGYILFSGKPTAVDPVILGRVMGTLDSALMLVLSYFYGSSVGSASKTEAINQIAVRK